MRRESRAIRVGQVVVGGEAPVSVQSMTKTDTRDIHATREQVARLVEAGCEIVRVAIPDMEAAQAFAAIRRDARVPLVADIHFDYRLAVAVLESGADGLRLNPGNIRRLEHLKQVVARARERSTPIRIGVNAGSIPVDYLPDEPVHARMVSLAEEQVSVLEGLGFDLIKVSLKASDVLTTIAAYRAIAERIPYPLHLGVTEAGPPMTGAVRNSIGIGILLNEGIGDTVRVSLSGDPVLEVDTGREILRSLGLMRAGPVIISCPTCGRTTLDVPGLAARVNEYVRTINSPIRIAIMGCTVNGPGECRHADAGIAGGEGKVALYSGGTFLRAVPTAKAYDALTSEIGRLVAGRARQDSDFGE
ncbi:MAG: flavodoxin-dependent (E)-4-hydroxy-3-methylbut-2-enyl-diphosphate synthase [Chloroflexota bacterium]